MFVSCIVIKLLSVLGTGFVCSKLIVCYNLHRVSGIYVCSSRCDKAVVRTEEVFLWFQVHCLFLPPSCELGLCVFPML